MDTLRREIARQAVDAEVQVTTCGCLYFCENGPNMVVYFRGPRIAVQRRCDRRGFGALSDRGEDVQFDRSEEREPPPLAFSWPALSTTRQGLLRTVDLWPRWSTLTEAIRRGTAVADENTGVRDEGWTDAFIAAMHRNAAARAPAVVRAVGVDGARRMLDVGGGSGAYSIAFAKAAPELQAGTWILPKWRPSPDDLSARRVWRPEWRYG